MLLGLPTQPRRRIALPYLFDPPPPIGPRLPNGTILVSPAERPSQFYKFTRWKNATLAFNEVDVYSHIAASGEISGVVRLLGVSGTEEHFVRVLERSHRGALDRFLLGEADGEFQRVDIDAARSILAQIAETMAGLHALDLVHRDLKAENILVFDAEPATGSQTITPKIADFDRALVLPAGSSLEEPVGSLFHMAPELLSWQPYDRKIDVYAFGILMFEVLHGGARAYTNVATSMPGSLSRSEFAEKVVGEGFRPDWRHEDAGLKRLAFRCWAANPADRPEFHEISDLLAASLQRKPISHPVIAKADRPEGFGFATTIGEVRTGMEDAVCVLDTPGMLVAAVFDGLRGHRTSEFAARRLAVALADAVDVNPDDPEGALRRAFDILDSNLRELEPPLQCGSTATVALLRDDELLVSWLGDSPAFLIRSAETGDGISAAPLVGVHHPSRDDEAARVTAGGGVIAREQRLLDNGEAVPWGPLRVFAPGGERKGGIALSRALGLFPFKPAIGGEPELIRLTRQGEDLFLILATDGVFDVLDIETASRIIAAAGSPQQAADAVIEAVSERGAPDNASVIVIDMTRSRRA